MSSHIPSEILIEILARLPVKSLLRFTSVCKSWYSLIKNPNFISTHLSRTSERNPELLLRLYTSSDKKEHYLLLSDDEKFDENYVELEFSFESPIGYFRIVGSCNGLVCLCDDLFQDPQKVIIWNPSIRKSVTLPLPDKPQNPYTCVLGFGFVPKCMEFKVVRIVYERESLNQCKLPPKVDVYEQGKGLWRGVKSPPPQYGMVDFLWSQVFLNGAVHWVAYDPSVVGGFHSLIVVFSMDDEVFGEVILPPALAAQQPTCLCVSLFRESLAMFSSQQSGCGSCSIWVMVDYGLAESWIKLYYISLPGVLSRTLGFRTNGEILLTSDTGVLISYDSGTKTIMNTRIRGSSHSLKVQTFVESLVLLGGENALPDWQVSFF